MTPDDNEWRHVFIHEESQHFEFLVQACQKAEVYLSTDVLTSGIEGSEGYKFVIGASDNTRLELQKHPGDDVLSAVEDQVLLNCDSLRPFWIYWAEGHLIFGKGKLFDNQLMSFQDGHTFPIRTIAVSPKHLGDGYATWEFLKNAGMNYILYVWPRHRFTQSNHSFSKKKTMFTHTVHWSQ